MSAYLLQLTEEDVETIAFVGARYSWSEALSHLMVGENELTEPEAWELAAAFERDTEGGHGPFPLLDPRSELYGKLLAFWNSVT